MTITEQDIATIIIKIKLPDIRRYIDANPDFDYLGRNMMMENYFSERPSLKIILDKSKFDMTSLMMLM